MQEDDKSMSLSPRMKVGKCVECKQPVVSDTHRVAHGKKVWHDECWNSLTGDTMQENDKSMSLSPRWSKFFIGLAKYISTNSKDPSTKVGAVIVDDLNRIVSAGFNGFPRGIKDDERLQDRETKYCMILHAEMNAILLSPRPVRDCIIYLWPAPPCAPCACAIIQAGIRRVIAPPLPANFDRWKPNIDLAKQLFAEAGVDYIEIAAEPHALQNEYCEPHQPCGQALCQDCHGSHV